MDLYVGWLCPLKKPRTSLFMEISLRLEDLFANVFLAHNSSADTR